MQRLLALARRVRTTVGGEALWDAVRPAYWSAMSRLSGESGVPMRLTDGHEYRLDPTLYAWQPDTFEPEVMRVVLPAVARDPASIVYDVGAHVGLVSLMVARCLESGHGRVFAFEPSPDNFALLERHIRANACGDRITACRTLVGERSVECVDFSYRPGQFTANSLVYDQPDGVTAAVPMVSIDDLVYQRGLPAPDVIKIDVEGYEHAVLTGAQTLLARRAPLVICAMHPDALAALATSADAIIRQMAALGYAARDLSGQPIERAGFEEVVFAKGG